MSAPQQMLVASVTKTPAVWVQTDAPSAGWTGLSTLGSLIYAVGTNTVVQISRNRGATWNASGNSPTALYTGVANSSGSKAFAITDSNAVWFLDTSGVTWPPTAFPATGATSCTMTSDGVTGYLVNNTGSTGNIYKSTDSGGTWVLNSATGKPMLGIAISQNGVNGIAINNSSSYPYITTNSGVDWLQNTTKQDSWGCCACSSTGTIMYLGTKGTNINRSSDTGGSWTALANSGNRIWTSIKCSDDGTRIIATEGSTAKIYLSLDSGATWTVQSPTSVSASGFFANIFGDGTLAVAADRNGRIYVLDLS